MNSIGQNILEQEDMIKGMPDESLQMEMQMPTGRFPEFLILSEIQRRTDMRQRYASQQGMDMPTVKDQVVANGLAAMATTVSPVPAASNSPSPNVPLGDSQQGLAGAGIPMMASGGKTEGSNGFPDLSGDGKISQKDVLIGKGVITASDGTVARSRDYRIGSNILVAEGKEPRDYPSDYVEAVGRSAAQGFYDLPADSAIGSLVRRPTGSAEEAERASRQRKEFVENLPSTEEMIGRYNLMEEMEEPLGGVGAEERQGRIGTALQEIQTTLADPDRFPYTNMPDEASRFIDPVSAAALSTREGIIGGVDTAKILGETGLDAALDFLTVAGSGDPTDPEAQRRQAAEEVVSSAGDFFSGENLGLRAGQALNLFEDYIYDPASNLIDYVSEKGGEFLTDPENIEAFRDKVSGAREYLTEEGPQGERSLLNRFLDTIGATDYVEGLGNLDNVDGKVDTGAGQQTSSTTDNNATRTDDSRATNLLQTPVGTIDVSGIMSSQEPVGYMEQAEEALGGMDATQADVLENMQQLIQQTQDAAKRQAFNVGLMNLAAGIASGKPDLGLGSAATSTAQILGRGETAAAPIRAAAAQQPMTAMKDKVAALTNLARVDVSRQQMEGLNFRSDNALKTAALDAAEAAVKEGLVVFDSAEEMSAAVAQAANDIYLQLRGTYGSTPTISQGMVRDINPDTGRLRYGAESAR